MRDCQLLSTGTISVVLICMYCTKATTAPQKKEIRMVMEHRDPTAFAINNRKRLNIFMNTNRDSTSTILYLDVFIHNALRMKTSRYKIVLFDALLA
jgi:hypothetical protein